MPSVRPASSGQVGGGAWPTAEAKAISIGLVLFPTGEAVGGGREKEEQAEQDEQHERQSDRVLRSVAARTKGKEPSERGYEQQEHEHD